MTILRPDSRSLRKRLIASLAASRTLRLAGRVFGRGGILYFHDVTDSLLLTNAHITRGTFANLIEDIARDYRVLPLSEVVSRKARGESLRGCVAISFDDAYRGVLYHALPVLEQAGAPATVFVASDYAERGAGFWWDRLEWIRQHAPHAARRVLDVLLRQPGGTFQQAHERITTQLQGRCSPEADASFTEIERTLPPGPLRPMSSTELVELGKSPLIDFGTHTRSHPALPALPPEEQEREIRESHAWLAARLPRVLPFVAYPYGLYDRRSMEAARAAGMMAGFGIEGHAPLPWGSPFAIPRIAVTEDNAPTLGLRLNWLATPALLLRSRNQTAQ